MVMSMDQTPFTDLPAALVEEVLSQAGTVAEDLLASFRKMKHDREALRRQLTQSGTVFSESSLGYPPLPTTCGTDGSYAIERLLTTDLSVPHGRESMRNRILQSPREQGISMDTYKVKLTFTEPLLGTVALDKKMYEEYILSKHPELEEKYNDELETIETLDEAMEKGTTGFHRHGGQPILYDYAIKGYFKEACYFMRRVPRSLSSKVTAYKKVIDGLVFVEPRRIPIQLSGDVDILTRPLRAQTAQGERVALSRSEMIPRGSTMEFQVKVLGEVSQELLEEWLAYGSLHGLGQWRSASYGRFNFELTKL